MRSFLSSLCVSWIVVAMAGPALGGETADAQAEEAAARLLKERMKTQRPEDLAILEAASGRDIVVVQGSMDHIEDVLSAAGIAHRLVSPEQVARTDLHADQIVMVNCPGVMPPEGVRRIERFVRAGGLLYTTDWALKNLVQVAFPGTIAHNGGSTGDHVTPVAVHTADSNFMSNMLLRDDSKPQWWLEGGSYPIRVLGGQKVKVLASSGQMKKRYGAGPVVVRFPWEDGQVIHVVSHFYRQAAAAGPTVATKDALRDIDGLTDAQRQQLASSRAGDVRLSEVESSYAFQQMTSNIVVEKAKDRSRVDRVYRWQNAQDTTVGGRRVKAGTRLKVVGKKGRKVRVRDDRGNEAWLDDELVEVR